ncbi:SDR family NAD(P)-dependent oxidoreductase [Chitinophaga caseinilytica]|uniref:SDR family NAD(P)-dependent oxidoreductase n=1 Tax=Chitinophaga caseinilytica TaxID=2267521 RepID=A0ABZ2Z478_9BACT
MKRPNTALITGANAGIGLALSARLLGQGYRVIGTSRSGYIDALSHPQFFCLQLDVRDPASIEACRQSLAGMSTSIDLLINNAGVADDVFQTVPERTSFENTFSTNVTGLVFFTEAVIGLVPPGGQVINISTDMSLLTEIAMNGPAYRMSKGAVNIYTKMLAQRLTEKKITVTAVHPGWVRTKLGGDQAPLLPEASAAGILDIIFAQKDSGEFRNVATGKHFAL